MMEPTSSVPNDPNVKLREAQRQVDEVVGVMRTNVEKVLERGQNLSELDSRADALQENGRRFVTNGEKLKRKYWWKNLKMMVILAIVSVLLLAIIIVSVTLSIGGTGSGGSSDENRHYETVNGERSHAV